MLALLTTAVALALPNLQGPTPDSIIPSHRWGPSRESAVLMTRPVQPAPAELRLQLDNASLAPRRGNAEEPLRPGNAEEPVRLRRAEGPPRLGDAEAPPQLVEYSDAYFTRLTIHRWASYLTLPLFAGQYVVGQKLMNGDGSDSLRGVHGALAGTLAGLFAVNTVTGLWNLYDARQDSEGRTRRTIHSVLMLLADAGFVATAALANENENEHGYYGGSSNNNAHRNMAIASMGTALFSYAIMLPLPIIGRK